MSLKNCHIALFLFVILFQAKGQDQNKDHQSLYQQSFEYLTSMLEGDTALSFKEAVLSVENAYMNGQLNKEHYQSRIDEIASIALAFNDNSTLLYQGPDKDNMQKLGSLFTVMTATQPIFIDSGYYLKPSPFQYDFDDFWGDRDWTKMFVTKLLDTQRGNCHSLPYLYQIVAEELDAESYLSFAPNHIYIKVRSHNPSIGWFNTELTNATFPIDAWIKSSGYVHLDAIRNSLYMDTLSKKQEITACLIDLAKGYERLFEGTEFIHQCVDKALEYYPNYANALLLKAETLKKDFEKTAKEMNATYPKQAFSNPGAKATFDEMEQLYVRIFNMGYRTMPKEMYVDWLADLKENKEKYLNKNLIHGFTQEQ